MKNKVYIDVENNIVNDNDIALYFDVRTFHFGIVIFIKNDDNIISYPLITTLEKGTPIYNEIPCTKDEWENIVMIGHVCLFNIKDIPECDTMIEEFDGIEFIIPKIEYLIEEYPVNTMKKIIFTTSLLTLGKERRYNC